MTYETPNTTTSNTPETETSNWERIKEGLGVVSQLLLIVIISKLFGIFGGLVTFGSYYLLKPKIGTWRAVLASGIIGVSVAILSTVLLSVLG